MSAQHIASLGRMLAQFLTLFADCFCTVKGRQLLHCYVRGLLSNVQRKNVEAIALDQGVAPRTLQRFLESINELRKGALAVVNGHHNRQGRQRDSVNLVGVDNRLWHQGLPKMA